MGAAIDVVSVRHSYPYLYAVSDTLGADVLLANAGAPASLVTGLATDRNAVVLTLPQGRALTRNQRRFVANAQRTYGTAVVLERSATAYTARKQACRYEPSFGLACDKPLRGGPAIDNPSTSFESDCSAGFITRSRSDSKPYLLTAGHCGSATWWTHFSDGSSRVIGTTWGTLGTTPKATTRSSRSTSRAPTNGRSGHGCTSAPQSAIPASLAPPSTLTTTSPMTAGPINQGVRDARVGSTYR
jgi:hypothetical protein